MNTQMDLSLGARYKSKSQAMREISEGWIEREMFCVVCDSSRLINMPRNTPSIDFKCVECHSEYQLKSRGRTGNKVVDGAYSKMAERVSSGTLPNLILLQYDPLMVVADLEVVPSFFFYEAAIEKRKPLSPNAKRANWVGCNILLDMIPTEGHVVIIRRGSVASSNHARILYRRICPMAGVTQADRGWLISVLQCLDGIASSSFDLDDVYAFEAELKRRYPQNNNVRAKIRQQLQKLRDLNIVRFLGNGKYERISE